MKHNNDMAHFNHNSFFKCLLQYQAVFWLLIILFCLFVLIISNQIFSQSDSGERINFVTSSIQSDSQAPIAVEHESKSFINGVLIVPTIFAKLFEVLIVLNDIATLILKVACIYFFIAATRLLEHCRSVEKFRQSSKRESENRKKETSESCLSIASDVGETIQNIYYEREKESFNSDVAQSDATNSDLQATEVKQEAEEYQQEEPVCFDLQDEIKAMRIMEGDIQRGTIYFVKAINGALKGIQIHDGRYQVYPKMQEITESELNYSSIKVCFELDRRVTYGKRFKIHFDQPAILVEKGKEVYVIQEKGKLTVIDTIE